jgi:hypothetical protein
MSITKKNIYAGVMLLLLTVITSNLKAQHVELTPFLGYATPAKMYTNQGDLRIDGGMNYGISLSIGLAEGMSVSTTFNQLKSSLTIDRGSYTEDLTDISVQYYTIGVLKDIIPDGKVTPFGFLELGMANYIPKSSDYSSEQKFDVDLGLGLKIKASEKVGFRMQARLHLPMYLNGLYFSGGTNGAGAGVTSTVIMVQGDFTGSIYFILGK